jgi:hypothetical protein
MKFYIIDRTDANFGKTIFDNAHGTSVWMLGRKIDNYHIIKEDNKGTTRVVPTEGIRDITALEEVLEKA